jgi:hypothetical protein
MNSSPLQRSPELRDLVMTLKDIIATHAPNAGAAIEKAIAFYRLGFAWPLSFVSDLSTITGLDMYVNTMFIGVTYDSDFGRRKAQLIGLFPSLKEKYGIFGMRVANLDKSESAPGYDMLRIVTIGSGLSEEAMIEIKAAVHKCDIFIVDAFDMESDHEFTPSASPWTLPPPPIVEKQQKKGSSRKKKIVLFITGATF